MGGSIGGAKSEGQDLGATTFANAFLLLTMTDTPASLPARAAALLVGLTILVTATVISFGLALAAPIGMWLLHRFRQARGRRFGATESWTTAAVSVGLVMLIVAGGFSRKLPDGTWRQLRHAADSASIVQANEPQPDWVRRVAPRTAARVESNGRQSPAMNTALLVWGLAMTIGFTAMIFGSLAWAGSMLIALSVSGYWLGRTPSPVLEPTAA